ncbi:MAG: pilin [Candidatus Pacebacteria bacterium]|nr:pilin [Candidatus Paceibacterota bacterium]
MHTSTVEGGGCGKPWIKEYYACDSWQKCEATPDYMQCYCDANCLDYPLDRKYYDNPEPDPSGGRQPQNENRINLPVALAWENIPGWAKKSPSWPVEQFKNVGEGQYGFPTDSYLNNFYEKGPKSYIIEIQDDPSTPNSDGTTNMNLPADLVAKNAKVINVNGRKTFQEAMQINQFNSRANGGECFFNTNSKYRWRVYACCDNDGTDCADPSGATWWTFTTSPAPEPLGIADKNRPNESDPAQDPDWNGSKHLQDVDFCSSKLLWCKAKLTDNASRFWKNYNSAQADYAINYQMRVKFSENWSLGIFPKSTSGGAIWQNYLNNALNSLSDVFSKYLEKAVRQAVSGDIDYQNQESCHYLKKKDNVCEPELVSFEPYLDKVSKDPKFHPFYNSSTMVAGRTNLFTGNMAGDLVYSWQLQPCFDIGDNNDTEFPFCSKSIDIGYGQKWKFSGARIDVAKIEPPNRKNPENNPSQDKNKLVGSNEQIQWLAPCGANSFLYDIKEKNTGKSIFTDAQAITDGGRRTTSSQIILSLTEKNNNPVQGSDPQRAILKIDTIYEWRVKSCWPSLPLPSLPITQICSDKWSSPFYFLTTGRPPVETSLQNTNDSVPHVTFTWEGIAGKGSYNIKIFDALMNELPLAKPNPQRDNFYDFSYQEPNIKYYWKVQTCANADGTVCGDFSALHPYTSKDFKKPSNLSPAGQITQLPSSLTWDSEATYFLVNARFSGEQSTSCDPAWFNSEYKNKKITTKNIPLKTKMSGGSQYCAGNYWFSVQPCFDANCSKLSNNYSEENFSLADSGKETGFMVCGQKTNDPKTDYNEKEPCSVKHLILTVKVIVNFIVFKVAFWLLPILLGITGYFFYTSQGNPKIIGATKDAWKKIGIGYAVLFFAWVIVSIIMQIAGYSAATSWSAL